MSDANQLQKWRMMALEHGPESDLRRTREFARVVEAALRDLSQVANRVNLSGHEPHQNELARATGAAIAALAGTAPGGKWLSEEEVGRVRHLLCVIRENRCGDDGDPVGCRCGECSLCSANEALALLEKP